MGEYLRRDPSDPNYVPEGKGMGADSAKLFQAIAIAGQTGKTVEEVLAFMGVAVPAGGIPAPAAVPATPVATAPAKEDPSVFLPADAEVAIAEAPATPAQHAKPKAVPKETPADGFVVTEVIDPKDA